MSESQHHIHRSVGCRGLRVRRESGHLLNWAAGLSGAIEQRGGRWFAESPMGEVEVTIVPENPLLRPRPRVKLADGTTFNNPMRVIADGTGCEVVFTLRRRLDQSDDDYEADTTAIQQIWQPQAAP